MSVTFERATAADADDFLKVQAGAFDNPFLIYPNINIVLRKIQQDDAYKIVFEGRLVGGMVVCDKGEGHVHLDMMFLDPEYHNRGIGTQAMAFLERSYAAKKWTLDTPVWELRNQHFYEKVGYVKVSQTEYEHITLIGYEKTL
jgi:ribosomal protein S18 acetylase RimI-like enzyme